MKTKIKIIASISFLVIFFSSNIFQVFSFNIEHPIVNLGIKTSEACEINIRNCKEEDAEKIRNHYIDYIINYKNRVWYPTFNYEYRRLGLNFWDLFRGRNIYKNHEKYFRDIFSKYFKRTNMWQKLYYYNKLLNNLNKNQKLYLGRRENHYFLLDNYNFILPRLRRDIFGELQQELDQENLDITIYEVLNPTQIFDLIYKSNHSDYENIKKFLKEKIKDLKIKSFQVKTGDILNSRSWNEILEYILELKQTLKKTQKDLENTKKDLENSKKLKIWTSKTYGKHYNSPAGNWVEKNIGNKKFQYCALSNFKHDGANGGYCNLEKQDTGYWNLKHGKWQLGGYNCSVICIE
jgi:hypothetical protein